MKSLVLSLISSLFLISALSAQKCPEVEDGSYWSFGGSDVVKVDVSENPAGGVWVTAVSAGGFSNPATGTAGPSSTTNDPTCTRSAQMLIGSEDYLVDHGVVKRKNAHGKWVSGKRVKKPTKKNKTARGWSGGGNIYGTAMTPADDVTGIPR